MCLFSSSKHSYLDQKALWLLQAVSIPHELLLFFFFKDQARTWGPFLPCLSGGYRILGAQSQCSLSDHLLAWLTNSASAANTCQPCCLPIHLPSQPLLSHQQMPPSPARPNCISRNASGNASTSLSPLSCLAG